MSQISSDGMGVEVTTGDGAGDKVMVYALTAHGRRDYRALSGSEQFRVALALRIGLLKCLAARNGFAHSRTITLDEGWGALDATTKRDVLACLGVLSREFDIYKVSHIDDVRAAFSTVIDVAMVNGSSVATLRTVA